MNQQDKLIECDRCEKWVCIKCSNLKVSQYDAIDDNLIWFCRNCRKPALHAVKTDQSIEEKCNLFLESFRCEKRINEKMSKIEMKVTDIESNQTPMANPLTDISSSKNNTKHSSHTMADEAIIKEVQIREERKYNAILFHVKELQTNLKEERKQYDRNSVNDILDICDDTLGHDSFANLIRLGKKQEG